MNSSDYSTPHEQVISIFTIIGAAFIPIGYFCLKASQQVCSHTACFDFISINSGDKIFRYTDLCLQIY